MRLGLLSVLHAQLEGEPGEGFPCRVIAKPRPPFLGDPASGFHPCFALRAPLEGVSIFLHHRILAQSALRPGTMDQNFSAGKEFCGVAARQDAGGGGDRAPAHAGTRPGEFRPPTEIRIFPTRTAIASPRERSNHRPCNLSALTSYNDWASLPAYC